MRKHPCLVEVHRVVQPRPPMKMRKSHHYGGLLPRAVFASSSRPRRGHQFGQLGQVGCEKQARMIRPENCNCKVSHAARTVLITGVLQSHCHFKKQTPPGKRQRIARNPGAHLHNCTSRLLPVATHSVVCAWLNLRAVRARYCRRTPPALCLLRIRAEEL
jgi:hypothetical protein